MESTSKTLELAFLGKPKDDEFSPLRLPINKDVLRRLLLYIKVKKLLEQKNVNQTSTEIINKWKKVSSRATPGCQCFQSINTVKKKLTKLLIHYRSVVKAGEALLEKPEMSVERRFLKFETLCLTFRNLTSKKICAQKITTSL